MNSTVYIVDDAADYRLLAKQVFSKFLPQYTVQFFDSGNALYEAVTTGRLNQPPGLILLDLHMPGRDGVATLRFIRQSEPWSHVPVVVMSSAIQPAEADVCYEVGASSVMQKPMAFDQLIETLKTVCQYWLDPNQQL